MTGLLLPEGLEALRWGKPADDLEFVAAAASASNTSEVMFSKLGSGLVVKAMPGYAIRYDILTDDYILRETLREPLTVSAYVTFVITELADIAAMRQNILRIKSVQSVVIDGSVGFDNRLQSEVTT